MLIATYSGILFDLAEPKIGQVLLEDIAHALACIPRFTGHAPRPYSVAQHCVLCSRVVPSGHELSALMHDAHEAYVGDVSMPLKALLPDFRRVEARVEQVVRNAFALPEPGPEIKEADIRMLATEAKAFGMSWWKDLRVPPYPLEIEPWSWHRAKQKFLARAKKLGL